MQLLESYKEYADMIREFREKCRRPFSNIYFMPADMERYIRLGRLSYEKSESGIILYFDEERFYRVCLCVNEKEKFTIERQDKKILVKNVFRKGKKRDNLQKVEQRLTELGFENEGTSVKVKGEVQKLLQKCERMERYADALDRKGYRFAVADASMIEEIETIILDSGVIKDYQLNYLTEEEKKEMAGKGCYACILNNDNQICGGGYCLFEGDVTRGMATAIKEEYKKHGIAPVLTYHRLKWLRDNGYRRGQGWILTSNYSSIKYHESFGYEFTDEYTDEWILKA